MKTISVLVILVVLSVARASAGDNLVLIEIGYRKVDPAMAAFIFPHTGSGPKRLTMAVKDGSPGMAELVKEVAALDESGNSTKVRCGAMCEITVTTRGRQIDIVGTSTLRYPRTRGRNEDVSVAEFVTHKAFLQGTLEDGEVTVVKTSGNQEILLRATVVNDSGQRVNEQVSNRAAHANPQPSRSRRRGGNFNH